MQAEIARQCMNDIGLSRENADLVAELLLENRSGEAKQRLRRLRCELMEEMHRCQRKLDRLDWLIRETEKAQND